jgi:2-dehydropantoate 2-reductase
VRRSAEMRIAVVGTGGVGGYFGARLAAGGNPVTFVARGQHLEAIQRNGLTIQSSRGDLHLDNAMQSIVFGRLRPSISS